MADSIYRTPAAGAAIEAQYRDLLTHWPVPHTERFIDTSAGRTFVNSCGPEDAPPVILLHGSQANSAAWMEDAALWSKDFRLHAIDMIGEAGLSAPLRPDLATDIHARWLDDVLAALGVTNAVLVGTSLGGWLALDYANRRPHRVRALALLCPAGIGRQKNFLLKALPLLLLGRWGQHKIRELVLGPPPADITPDLARFGLLMNAIGRHIKPRILAIPRLTDAELAALKMPILTILGGRDVLLNSSETRTRLQRHAPHAEILYLPTAPHYLPGHSPRILSFLHRVTN